MIQDHSYIIRTFFPFRQCASLKMHKTGPTFKKLTIYLENPKKLKITTQCAKQCSGVCLDTMELKRRNKGKITNSF